MQKYQNIKLNSHSKSALSLTYQNVKEVQKKMSIKLLEFEYQYENNMKRLHEVIDVKLNQIKNIKKNIEEEFQMIKKEIQSIKNQEWHKFQNYAKHIRKIYLAQLDTKQHYQYRIQDIKSCEKRIQFITKSLSSSIDQLQNGNIFQLIQNNKTRKGKHEDRQSSNIRAQHQISSTLSKRPKELMLNNVKENINEDLLLTINNNQSLSISKRVNIKNKMNDIDISPIKFKDNLHFNHNQLAENFVSHDPQLSISNKESEQKISDVFRKTQKSKNRVDIVSLKNINQYKSERLSLANKDNKDKKWVDFNQQIKRYPESSQQNKNQGIYERFQKQSVQKLNPMKQFQLSRVKSEDNIKKGYKNCLEMLQKQKYQYDKLRKGLK